MENTRELTEVHHAPGMIVSSKKFGDVTFVLLTDSKGYAKFEPFKLRGIEYKGTAYFEFEMRAFGAENCEHSGDKSHSIYKCDKPHFRPVSIDYSSTYIRRTEYDYRKGYNADRLTDAASDEVYTFVKDEALRLFQDREFVQEAHVAEVRRMVYAEQKKIDETQIKLDDMRARLADRKKQLDGAERALPSGSFCGHEARNGHSERCVLPALHDGGHEYGKR